MRFTQDSGSAANLVRAYGQGELRINEDTYRSSIIVSASAVIATPDIRRAEDLAGLDPSRILALDPEAFVSLIAGSLGDRGEGRY